MIVFSLKCSSGHGFEGWFSSVEDFDRQASKSLVACPMCTTTEVFRLPSGPRVKRASSETKPPVDPAVAIQQTLAKAYAEIVSKSENVAERFPEEARKIHYGEAPVRNIRGQATAEEARDLVEEGIEVMALPFAPKEDVH